MAAALTLSVFTLRARAYVETLADNTRVLTSPWTDADHSEACPASDPRICPVLALDNPAIIVRTKESRINLRSVATLSAAERAAGATTPFFLYHYQWDPDYVPPGASAPVPQKRYKVCNRDSDCGGGGFHSANGTTVEVTFTFTMGSMGYSVEDASRCGVLVRTQDRRASPCTSKPTHLGPYFPFKGALIFPFLGSLFYNFGVIFEKKKCQIRLLRAGNYFTNAGSIFGVVG